MTGKKTLKDIALKHKASYSLVVALQNKFVEELLINTKNK